MFQNAIQRRTQNIWDRDFGGLTHDTVSFFKGFLNFKFLQLGEGEGRIYHNLPYFSDGGWTHKIY